MNSTTKKPRRNFIMDTQISQDNRESQRQRLHHIKSEQNLILLQRTTLTGQQLKIEQSLQKELQQVKQIIIKYTNQLQNKSYVSMSTNSISVSSHKISNTGNNLNANINSQTNNGISNEQYVRLMEQLHKNIELKNWEINSINQEIKGLKSYPLAYKDPTKNRLKSNQYGILADQIANQRKQLLQLQQEHRKLKQSLTKNRKQMKQKLQQYNQLPNSPGKKLISFGQFISKKNLRIKDQKDRDDSNKKSRKVLKKVNPTKETVESQDQNKYVINSTNLTDAENKKKVALGALRTLKRTHRAEMNELNGKLQFLHDQHEQLIKKTQEKDAQLKKAQAKFNQTKQKLPSSKNIKIGRFSQPQADQ